MILHGLARSGVTGEGQGEKLMASTLQKAFSCADEATPGALVLMGWGAAMGGVGIRSSGMLMERVWPLSTEVKSF